MIRPFLERGVSLVPWQVRGVIRKLPLVAPFQRWLVARFLAGREFNYVVNAGPARGLNYPIKLPEDKGIWTGTYELLLTKALADTVRPGDVCCDIGGWRGFVSGVMALSGARRVYVFEPLPANVRQIRRVMALNPHLPLELVEAAVGEQAGQMEFWVMPETSMGKLAGSPFQEEQRISKRIEVEVVALDDLIASGRIEPPAVLKVDVEGAELLVLRGASELLQQGHPKLFIEIHSRQLGMECAGLLRRWGYSLKVLETGLPPDGSTESEVCHLCGKL